MGKSALNSKNHPFTDKIRIRFHNKTIFINLVRIMRRKMMAF